MQDLVSASVLGAGLHAQEALARLLSEAAPSTPWVVIRRVDGLVIFWYLRDRETVLPQLRAAPKDQRLLDLFQLKAASAAPVAKASADLLGTRPSDTLIVVEGGRCIGVRVGLTAQPANAGPSMAPPTMQPTSTVRAAPVRPSSSPTRAPPRSSPAFGGGVGRTIERALRSMRGQSPNETAAPAGAGASAGAGSATASPPVPPAQPATGFSAWPRLSAPERVEAQQAFTVVVGLAELPQPQVQGGLVRIALPASITQFELDVLLLVDGFEAPQGLRRRLQVSRAHPGDAHAEIALIAPVLGVDAAPLLTTLTAVFLYEGQPCGTALRRLAVTPPGHQPADDPQGSGQLWTRSAEPVPPPVQLRPGLPPVDLTVIIDKPSDDDAAEGRYVWSFASPHAVALPDRPQACDIGSDSAQLGGKIIAEVQASQAQGFAELMIQSLGKTIRQAMPPAFWPVLSAVHQAMLASGETRLPNVLMLTTESHVPWELALMEEADKLAPDAPPHLGCQVNIGRWPLRHAELPPREQVAVRHLAVVFGDYAARSLWRKLDKAEQEARQLGQLYGGILLQADAAQLKQLLYAKLGPPSPGGAEVVHFACHGEALQDHVLDAAVILENGARLSPLLFGNAPLGKVSRPFLFMNACQVGKAGELLASFSGFAGEAIKGGFRGFLAPLWSVDDGLAHDTAMAFYKRAFGSPNTAGQPVAAILRELRAQFADDEPNSLTRLAYVYYGHPGLTLMRDKEA